VDDDRPVGTVVGSDVGEIEAEAHLVIDLDGAELPLAADDVLDDEVDLGAVEGGFAGFLGEGDAEGACGVDAGAFGLVPAFRAAGVLAAVRIAEPDADAVFLHAEDVEDGLDEGEAPLDLGGDLVLGAEEVGVVLGEAADAGHAVELAGLLPAVDGAELGEADGHVAVGVGRAREDLGVVGAVHGPEHEALDELVVGKDAVLRDDLLAGALVEAACETLGDALDAVEHLGAGATGL